MNVRRSHALKLLASAPLIGAPVRVSAQASKIRIGYVTVDSGMQPYYAYNGGYFAKAGLDVDILTFPNPGAMMEAIAGNALEVGLADILSMAYAKDHGVDFVYFAGGAMYHSDSPTTLMCVEKDSPYHSAKDLEGQSFGTIVVNSTTTLAARAWFDQNGVDSTKVKQFELAFPQMAPALQRGSIACAVMVEPFLTFARDQLRSLGKPLDTFAKVYCITGSYVTRDWATRNPQLVRKLTQAYYESARWANSHGADTLQMLAQAASIDIERIRGINRVQWATSLSTVLFQPVLDLAVKYSYLHGVQRAPDFFVRIL